MRATRERRARHTVMEAWDVFQIVAFEIQGVICGGTHCGCLQGAGFSGYTRATVASCATGVILAVEGQGC